MLQTFKDANVRSHIQSHKLVHVSGVSYKSWVPRITLLDEQVGLMIMLSEQNVFVCRGFTVRNYR